MSTHVQIHGQPERDRTRPMVLPPAGSGLEMRLDVLISIMQDLEAILLRAFPAPALPTEPEPEAPTVTTPAPPPAAPVSEAGAAGSAAEAPATESQPEPPRARKRSAKR